VPRFPHVTIESDGSLARTRFRDLDRLTIDLRNKGLINCNVTDPKLTMDDHGLFITGIVHDIAPTAQTHLIRALGSYGVTHTNLILPILRSLPHRFLDGDENRDKKLIINMSLGWTIPPGPAHLGFWAENAYGRLKGFMNAEHDHLEDALVKLRDSLPQDKKALTLISSILEDLHAPIREVMDFLSDHPGEYKNRILIVASAGNDNRWLPQPETAFERPEPRWPAYYKKALSVAAIGREFNDADYTNRGDILGQTNGVATFGGNATRDADDGLGVIDITADTVDAVIGVYTKDPVMSDAGPNTTGWVYWSGTSFATPVITGIAADHWAQHPDDGPQDVINAIAGGQIRTEDTYDSETREVEDANAGSGAIDCPKIYAWQEWQPATLTHPLHNL
jgi:hypothetical protein